MYSDEIAEKSALVSILSCKRQASVNRIMDQLSADLFYSQCHIDTFDYLAKCHVNGLGMQTEEVIRGLPMSMSLLIGGGKATCDLRTAMERLKRERYRRKMWIMAERIKDVCEDAAEEIDNIEDAIDEVLAIRPTLESVEMQTPEQVVGDMLTEMHEARDGKGLARPLCIDRLDRRMKMYDGDLVFIAARPSIGKTALAITSINNRIADKLNTGLICFEMSNKQIYYRLVSQRSGYTYDELREGRVSKDDGKKFEHFNLATRQLSNSCLQADCGRAMTLQEVKRGVRRMVCNGAGIVFVDYLQSIKKPGNTTMYDHMCKCTSELKELAMQLSAVIAVLAQINREGANAVPRVSMLKESGSIEQDADTIVLIDRPDYDKPAVAKRHYKELDQDGNLIDANMDGRAALLIAKHRNGPTGMTLLDFDAPTTRFHNDTFRPNPEDGI